MIDRFDPFGLPDCESEVAFLGDTYRDYFFRNIKYNHAAIDPRTYLIVGRRGSGKTALTQFFSFQDEIPNAIAIGMSDSRGNEAELYQQVMSKLAASQNQPRELAIPELARAWECLLWKVIFYRLRDRNKIFADVTPSGDIESHAGNFLRAILLDLATLLLGSDNQITRHAERFLADAQINAAKQAAIKFAKNNPLIIFVDTLETYTLRDSGTMKVLAALVQCAADFSQRFRQHDIHIKVCVAAEIFAQLRDSVILNPLKSVRDEVYLHWRPKELLRLMTWRMWKHLKRPTSAIDWNDYRSVLENGWIPFFGKTIVNGSGVVESTFPYVLRHTQLRPRQLIVLCNSIARCSQDGVASEWSGSIFSRPGVVGGIKAAEERLAEEVFNSYECVYQNAAGIGGALAGISSVFQGSELDRRGKITSSEWTTHYSLNSFRRFVSELGIVGVVRKSAANGKYLAADFEYSARGKIDITPDDTCAIHPMFYQKLRVQFDKKTVVFPFPGQEDFDELEYGDHID
ncbi:MAG: hypothetical protein AABP62_20460 [Planctomycetota bacterium]